MHTISRRLFIASSTLVVLGPVLGSIPAGAAQPSPEDMLTRLDGLHTAYSRKYIADRELGWATPVVADSATPDVLLVTVLEFGTEDEATAAFDSTMNGLVARMIIGEPDLDLEETVIDDLGDRALLYTGTIPFDDEPRHEALLAVQDGDLGILVQAHGPDPSLEDSMMTVADFMVDAEPGGEVVIDEFGASGGTFDIMPGRDEMEMLDGLVPMYDYDLLLDGGSHPLGDDGHGHEASPEASPAS